MATNTELDRVISFLRAFKGDTKITFNFPDSAISFTLSELLTAYDKLPENMPVPGPTPVPVPPIASTWQGITTDHLNVRSGPSTASSVLSVLQKGTPVTVRGSGAWLAIDAPRAGYVSATYVRRV